MGSNTNRRLTVGDFRVGSISSITPYGQEQSGKDSRKKDKRQRDPAADQGAEDIVAISGQAGDNEAVVDYYTPSRPDEEPE
jgi:hypothetical protein